ncbi:MAG TPA: flavoprotein [Nannocystaceae bacterium]|nr:flavoprotein [Nannocystaceae bacterium]
MGEQREARLRRAAIVRIYDVGEATVLLAKDGRGHELAGDSARLARAVLAFLAVPHTRVEIFAHLETLVGGPVEHPAVVEDLLAMLLGVEAIEPDVPVPARAQRHGPGLRVVVGLTGAVGSMYAPGLVQALLDRRWHVRVVATADALRFVSADALAALTHHRTVGDLWPTDEALPVPHINLAEWADAVLVCPASATTIARLATGDYGSIVSAIALATRAPVMIVPSMNAAMYASPSLQRNLAQLVDDGVHVVHPVAGIEVADAPDERVPTLGAAPPSAVVVQLFETMMRAAAKRGELSPRSADDWDAVYRRPADELPWHRDAIDDDLLGELQRLAPGPISVLDVGTGLGTFAVQCARLGHRVVATDLSARALARARALAPDAPVVWVQDDATDSRLQSTFDVVVDRGCLHLLGTDEARAYAATLARIVAPGGHVLLKSLTEATAASRGARARDATALRELFGDAFTVEAEHTSTLPGPSEAPQARLFVLRRTPPSS